jgi:glycosyltransferase involved in cell wall biosynthesis
LAKPGAEEIIVVDEGSTEGTLAGARQFELNEVRVVTQLNQRAAAARVPSAGDTTNRDELKDDWLQYAHVDELA